MRIVFMGTPAFAVPSLEALLRSGDSVVGVVTQPDRPRRGGGRRIAAAWPEPSPPAPALDRPPEMLRQYLEMVRLLDQTFAQIAVNPIMVARSSVPWQQGQQVAHHRGLHCRNERLGW